MTSDDALVVAYTVDISNRITWVDENWWPFARDNDAPELDPATVLGQDLLAYISDRTTSQLYKVLLDRVRTTQQTFSVAIRCDSPDKRRFLTITILPQPDGTVRFRSKTVREEIRPTVKALRRSPRRSDKLIRMCSWCKKVFANTEWLEIEQALPILGVLETDDPPEITHGICTACEKATR